MKRTLSTNMVVRFCSFCAYESIGNQTNFVANASLPPAAVLRGGAHIWYNSTCKLLRQEARERPFSVVGSEARRGDVKQNTGVTKWQPRRLRRR